MIRRRLPIKIAKTIFDLGYGGLKELAKINANFIQFEQTLFDSSSINLERSVESSDVNKLLNKTIKKFFYHLSPYLMLQPSHCCLEWLIRRFHIHDFNRDELLALIFPYHETKIFVKCVQLLNLSNPNDPWRWLQPLQKPGITLSKSVLFSRAACDPTFRKLVCKATTEAIKELDLRAATLQAQINFYCTAVIGALEYAKDIE